jgi:hypothetical protein
MTFSITTFSINYNNSTLFHTVSIILGVANKTIILSVVMVSVVMLNVVAPIKKVFSLFPISDCSTDPAWTSIHRCHLVVPLLPVTPTLGAIW